MSRETLHSIQVDRVLKALNCGSELSIHTATALEPQPMTTQQLMQLKGK